MNVASANTVTVNTSLFSAGDTLVIQNIGAGVTTVTAGTATVSSAGPLTIAQYGSGTLYFTSDGVSLFFPSAGPAVSSGLTLISATTTTGASVTVSNCFSNTYRNYLIVADSIVGTSDGYGLHARFGVSGTPTTTNYFVSNSTTAGSTVTFISVNTAGGAEPVGFTMNVFAPKAADLTVFTHYSHNMGGNSGRFSNGYQNSSDQFTDLVLFVESGSADMSAGTIRVYGYANS
jgi:hypothetical protein